MRRCLLIAGDIAAGKTSFSRLLSRRYGVSAFQKDAIKEILGDHIGWQSREDNLKLSNATMALMLHLLSGLAAGGCSVILEANFHHDQQAALRNLAMQNGYRVLTLVLRGDPETLHQRYLHRMRHENRHPVHLTTTLHEKQDFFRTAEWLRRQRYEGEVMEVNADDFSYQSDPALLSRIDAFMT